MAFCCGVAVIAAIAAPTGALTVGPAGDRGGALAADSVARAGRGIAQLAQAGGIQGRAASQRPHRSSRPSPASPQTRQRGAHSPRPSRASQPSTAPARPRLTAPDMVSRLTGQPPPGTQDPAMPAVSEFRASDAAIPRYDWTRSEVEALLDLPFTELLFRAASVHRQSFDPAEVQVSTLLSVKTGGCPEDCAYCPQAQRYDTGVDAQKLMETEAVMEKARQAKAAGASRFCMGAAWRSPKDRDIPKVAEMIRGVKALGLETCATLGMLTGRQAQALKLAGLDYYNHNIDTDPEYYDSIVGTREFQDRLDTLGHVRDAGLKTCCGGIVGMGESRAQRAGLLHALATLPAHPDSVPINRLVQVAGTPLAEKDAVAELDPFEFVRTIAVARILMPRSMVRLSAGREQMSDELQALCFVAGANSIFHGEKLLTTGNPDTEHDQALFDRLGLRPMHVEVDAADHDGGTLGSGGTVHADIVAPARGCAA